MNKVGRGKLFQILKDNDVKVLHSICHQIYKIQQWPQNWKRLVFIPIPKKALSCYAMLSYFSRVRLCATPQTAAHQAPPSLGFSRQEHGVGCHFLLQCVKVKSESEVAQSCPTPRDPMDCSPPGSSVHGIFQARVLEWGAIAFSEQTASDQ